MRIRVFTAPVQLALGLLLFGMLAFCQITGDILVNVSDQSGAAVPGATVTVKSMSTGLTREGTTDGAGQYRVAQLENGQYEVKVVHPGFASVTQVAQVSAGGVSTVPLTLSVSSTSEQVVVESQATPINTVNPQLQGTIESKAIVDLPLSTTGILGLAATMPGITPVTANNPFLGLGSYNSNGGRGRANNITLDGATTTDVSTTGSAGLGTIPADAIKEFNLITNQFNAEYGRNSNSQLQLLSTSGSNQLHGELFEVARNSYFNARDYFDRTGKATPNINNDWGAFAGGAIIKDKLFYFGSYEQNTIRGLGGTRIAIVPTPAQAASAVPIAQQILQLDHVPTSPTGQISQVAPSATDSLAYSARLDYNITQNDLLYMRFGEQSSHAESTGNTFIDSNLVTNGASSQNRPWNGTITETHTFGPTFVNTFLAAYGRSAPVFPPFQPTGNPEIIFTDGTSNFGKWSGLPQGRIQNTFQYLDTISKVWGRHNVKFGAEVDRVQANSFFDSNVGGSLTFTSLANFLNGVPFQYTQDFGNSVRGNRLWNEAFFVQDDWKISRNLTLNLGFREEIAGGVTEVNNIVSNINPALTNVPLGGAGTGPLGSFYTGGSYFHTNYNPGPRFGFAWNPAGGKTVIRGGYGISYDFVYLNPITNGRFLPPFMYTFTLPNTGFTGGNTVANILAGTSPFQQTGFSAVGSFGTTIKNFGNATYIDPHLRNPQVQQISLTVEREVFPGWLFRLGYSGALGHYLQRTRPLNFMQPGLFTPPTSVAQETANAALYQQLNAGLSGNASTGSNRIDPRFNAVSVVQSTANSNYHSLQLFAERRFASWYGFTAAYTWSKSIDDASDALGVLETDTAAQQNPNDNRNNRAVSQFDVPHRVVITHDFISPSNHFSSRALNMLVGGWQFTGVFQAQSGLPMNILNGSLAIPGTSVSLSDPSLLGGNNAIRPNLVGPLNIVPKATSGGTNPNQIPNSGLAQVLVGHFGTLGRNVFRINPNIQSDMDFGRQFKIRERMAFRIDAQFFNIFNNTTFSNAGSLWSLSAPSTFGYYTATDTNSRRVAFVGRLIW
ncbi:MAG TPA: carboxypeptidase regulatory-like domain-containing protein [Bryobacteraceae bacterium]|nr:carboxypeptidase regulatory-like domain-containing protein [Bryobacteraceae bacterium]